MRNDIILIFRNGVFVFIYLFINQEERDKSLLVKDTKEGLRDSSKLIYILFIQDVFL